MSLHQKCLDYVTGGHGEEHKDTSWAIDRAHDLQRFVLSLSADERQPKTIRDEFAMAALVNCADHIGNADDMAKEAYAIADAMLAARQANGE